MTPNIDINQPLIEPTPSNTHIADVDSLIRTYGAEKVEEAIKYLTYKKEIPQLPKEELKETPTLYVFRHGQSEDNLNMIFSGWRDAKLTKKGEEDAVKLAPLLKDKEIQLLISSDQQRTYKTMELAISENPKAKELEIIIDRRLRERHYGDWQGYSKLEKELEDPEALEKARRGWDTPPPNGESLEMVNERVLDLLDEIIPKMKEYKINVAIACSGNSIRPIRKFFENLTEQEASEIETPTGKDYAAYLIK